MKKPLTRKTTIIDTDHMRMLHKEAIEQLELMRTALEAAEHASGPIRDSLDNMATEHWQTYMGVMHMICLHDEAMNAVMKDYGLEMRHELPEESGREVGVHRLLALLLLLALLRRHSRLESVLSMSSDPMTDYLRQSIDLERRHVAELVSMIQTML